MKVKMMKMRKRRREEEKKRIVEVNVRKVGS